MLSDKIMKIARVMVNLSLDRVFDYLIPDRFESAVAPGVKVEIPFGKSKRMGFVVAVTEGSSYPLDKLKSISEIYGEHPKISEKLLKLGEWMADYYCCAREQTVKALLPAPVRTGKIKGKKLKRYYISSPQEAQQFVFASGKKKKKQAEILKRILSEPGISERTLSAEFKNPKQLLKKMSESGLLREETFDCYRNPFEGVMLIKNAPPELSGEQNDAVLKIIGQNEINPDKPGTVLLHGVTGSGKTEIYLRVIEKMIEKGRDSIVLVPEIALTPQTVERFRGRFGDNVSVLHSALSDGERYDEWMKIHRGKVRIAVGARSALFAPFHNLGLIVVDEEHETSYKQGESPRYNARDVAVMRGFFENALVILGSATPSLESYSNVKNGKYSLCELKNRVDNRLMPSVDIIDMRNEPSKEGGRLFSGALVEEIRKRLDLGEQTMIFLNRKGYATQMTCFNCGWTAECPDCAISYTYHKKRQSLSCHLCGALVQAPIACPQCGNRQIRYSGAGTEKIEGLCKSLFRGAGIARMDAETMSGRLSYEKVLGDFRTGRIDILVGTQMIAKGLDFPNVTLVGIICADLSLRIPDFRAEERTFQLITQVAGRAGRGDRPGEVIVQTYSPSNVAIQFAKLHDYPSFYNYEISLREQFQYPPSCHLLIIHLKGKDESAVVGAADSILDELKLFINKETIVSGPAPSPNPKIKGMFRYMIMLRGKRLAELKRKLRQIIYGSGKRKDVEIYTDIDAINIM
jgi:primosomal protein N' (replication factor Y)